MLKKFFHILKGWGKVLGIISISTAEDKLSDLRLSICEPCFHSVNRQVLELTNGDLDFVDTLVCKKCSCPCKQKSLVIDETCPIGKW